MTKDYTEMTKEEVYKDFGMFSSVKKRGPKTGIRKPPKKLQQCSKCGRVGDAMTKHSLAGGHNPPYIWLCRTPCHDEVHKFGLKMTKEEKAALKQVPECNIQFPTEDKITNPYAKLITPESLEGEKFRQPFSKIKNQKKRKSN